MMVNTPSKYWTSPPFQTKWVLCNNVVWIKQKEFVIWSSIFKILVNWLIRIVKVPENRLHWLSVCWVSHYVSWVLKFMENGSSLISFWLFFEIFLKFNSRSIVLQGKSIIICLLIYGVISEKFKCLFVSIFLFISGLYIFCIFFQKFHTFFQFSKSLSSRYSIYINNYNIFCKSIFILNFLSLFN